jgi:peptide/nickel transport system substrate-binding protein
MHSGLVVTDPTGAMQPLLAEAVPTTDNGLWKLSPDGKMETTLKIRPGAAWHDGAPLTADDFVWSFKVLNDRELPIFRNVAYNEIEGVEAVDGSTLLTRWKRPFIRADQMWSESVGTPLPKHILEAAYADKENFVNHPWFTSEFVGTGPYTLKEWETGTRVLLHANDKWVLGRPKIDEIEVRTIADVNVIVANLLSNTIDVVVGRTLALDHIITLRDRMPDIFVETPLTSFMVMNPQFLYETNPAIIRNVTFRKAMMHALNRQEMVDGIEYGLVPIANGVVYPTSAGKEIDAAAVRYDFDPRKTAQMVESLGLSKGPDGFYRDQYGQPMKIEIRATNSEINTKTMFTASDYLQRAGLATDPIIIPGQLVNDQEYRSKFPALIVNGGGGSPTELEVFHSSKVRTAETGYSGANRAGYQNAELDSLIDRYTVTIPWAPRMEIARQINRHMTDQLPELPLFFDTWPGAASPRLINARAASDGAQTWNIQQWDVKS